MKAVITGLVLSLIGTGVVAQSLDERMAMAAQDISIEEIITVPIRNLKAVESEGQIVFMSDNGRFVLMGQMIDVWHRKSLDTMAQIKEAVTRLSFEGMGLDIDQLNTISIGKGKSEVVAFVDPLCEACIKLMDEAEQLSKDYTFKFVFVPVLGADSVQVSKNISCNTDKAAALKAVRAGQPKSVPVVENCDANVFNTTLLSADLMGINGVPFIVAPDGEIVRGMPENLHQWLEGKDKK